MADSIPDVMIIGWISILKIKFGTESFNQIWSR